MTTQCNNTLNGKRDLVMSGVELLGEQSQSTGDPDLADAVMTVNGRCQRIDDLPCAE